MLMLDVDNFKRYNDTYGHPEGDKVLTTLGQVILSCVRDNDLPCRYGGEEFSVILPGGPGNVAVGVAERIRRNFEEKVFVPREGEPVHVTVSTGVAEHVTGENAEQLIGRADKALYTAKEKGKNCIILADR
jgi:diguanylate cyclase (GGDEF)-like protein